MDNLLQWSDTFARRGAYNEQKGRDALTESIGQNKAYKEGASFNEGLMAGSRFVEEQKDPMFELKKMALQANINEQSAQMADHYRKLKIQDAEIASEQRDKTKLMDLSLKYKGKPTEFLNALATENMESPFGLRQMNEQRLAITSAMDHDAWTKTYSELTPAGRAKVDAAKLKSGGVVDDDVISVFEAQKKIADAEKPVSTAGKLAYDREALIASEPLGENSPKVKRFDELSAKTESATTIGKLLAERKTASDEDRPFYDAALAKAGKSQGFSVQFDDQGRAIINYGPDATTVGKPSVATQSMAQRKLLKYEAAQELINHVQNNIQSGHIGISGVLGEYVGDKLLPQLGVDTFVGKRADVRTTLIAARESLLREISDDSRFSNADREEITKALPSSGVFESLPNALQRLETVRTLLNNRGKTYADGLGLPKPGWSMSKEEIKAEYDKFVETDGKQGLSLEKARDLIERFH